MPYRTGDLSPNDPDMEDPVNLRNDTSDEVVAYFRERDAKRRMILIDLLVAAIIIAVIAYTVHGVMGN